MMMPYKEDDKEVSKGLCIAEIKKVLDDFYLSEFSAIVISGPWGVGKTYALRSEYIKNLPKKMHKSFVYCSLFGKENIDQLNAEIYSNIHRHRARAHGFSVVGLKVVKALTSLAGRPLEVGSDGAKINFRLRPSKKFKTVIVFDDLERTIIDPKQLLGYIDSLVLSGMKVVLCADLSKAEMTTSKNKDADVKSEELDGKHILYNAFGVYGEKVFDWIYYFDKVDEATLKKLLGTDIDFGYGIRVFEENLRYVKKAKYLYLKIKKHFDSDESFSNWTEIITDKTLLMFSAYVVKEIFANKYSKAFFVKRKREGGRTYLSDIYDGAEEIARKILEIETGHNLHIGKTLHILAAVFDIATRDDFATIDHLVGQELKAFKHSDENQELFSSLFLLQADSGRMQLLKRQIEYIINTPNDKFSIFYASGFVRGWVYCNDAEWDLIEKDKVNLFKQIHKFSLYHGIFDYSTNKQRYGQFFEEFKKYLTEAASKKEISKFADMTREQMYDEIAGHVAANGWDPLHMEKLKEEIAARNFFIDNLHELVQEQDWFLVVNVCNLYKKYYKFTNADLDGKYKRGLLKALNEYKAKHSQDKACHQRIDVLLEMLDQ